MDEKIEVRYSVVGGGDETSSSLYHKYLVYTDQNGLEWYARGGPTEGPTHSGASTYFLGPITTEYGAYQAGTIDWDANNPGGDLREQILTAPNLSNYWNLIKERLDEIEDGYYLYSPAGQNSNAVIDDVLDQLGLPAATLDATLPSPGSGIPLLYGMDDIADIPGILADWLLPAKGMFDKAPSIYSPLVLDLDGDGVEVTKMGYGVGASEVYFDLTNDGFAERTAWVTGGDGLLAWDRNSNGLIDNQAELFGNSATHADGFAHLATLDTNSDSKITSADANWSDLRVWIDANEDGVTDNGELHTLSSLGITEISLNATALTNTYNNENLVSDTSSFVIGGQTRTISDIWFRHDPTDTRYLGDVELVEEVFYMPTLKGFGTVKDLHVSMSVNSDLLDLVSDFVAVGAQRNSAIRPLSMRKSKRYF